MRKEICRILATMAVVFLLASALYAGGTNPIFIVNSTIPRILATGVAEDQVLTVTFNQNVNCSTVTTSTFTLQSAAKHPVAVAGTVACSGTVATFTPSSPLAANTSYTATITNSVKNVNGRRLLFCFVWCFKTGSSLTAPTVTAVTPLNKATGVALNTKITAAFDQAMNPHTINALTFTLTGPGNKMVKGTITYDAINNIAIFTPIANLLANTKYTATITNCVTNLMGTQMVSNFVWTFTTGAAPDVIPPTVILTNPLNLATGVPLNQIITATFSEAMAPATIHSPATTFTLMQTIGSTPVSGTVNYAPVGNTASFTPTAPLLAGTNYTATITTGVTDLAGNHMASNYVWTFDTGSTTISAAPTVLSTNPANGVLTLCPNGAINATFSEPMDPLTINTGTFYVTGPASAPVLGTVSLDITGTIATFTPLSNLAPSTSYSATITTGVENLAEIAMVNPYSWSFSTGPLSATCLASASVPLNSAAPFGVLGGTAGMTNTGITTVINGDIGTTATAYTSLTGFHDLTVLPYVAPTSGCTYTETGANVGLVTGEIYTADGHPTSGNCPLEGTAATALIATTALGDASTAYTTLAGLPGGPSESGQLGGKTLFAGTYTSSTGFLITGGDLTLDAQGNANAVWVFQTGSSSLTVGTPSAAQSVILINGAQAKNVFWQVGSSATINGILGGGTMVGTIIAQAGISFSTVDQTTQTTLNGRAMSLTASVTLVDTTINVPAP